MLEGGNSHINTHHREKFSGETRGFGFVEMPNKDEADKAIVFLTEYAVVDRIIRHLTLTFAAEKPPPAQAFEQVAPIAAEESGDYE